MRPSYGVQAHLGSRTAGIPNGPYRRESLKKSEDLPTPVIRADGLGMRFGVPAPPVLDMVSFQVSKGEVFGVLGARGAGKTTLTRILAALERPTAGTATIAGHDVVLDGGSLRAIVGYLPQFPPTPRGWTVGKYLGFWAAVEGMSRSKRRERVAEIVKTVGLEETATRAIHECTTQEQRRMFLGLVLLNDPPVLLLDEPMEGIAPGERDALQGILRSPEVRGKTIFIVSSRLGDLHPICHRVMVLSGGRATRAFDTGALLTAVGDAHHARVFVRTRAPHADVLPMVRNFPGVVDVKDTEPAVILFVDSGRFRRMDLERALAEAAVPIDALSEADIALADVVRTLTRWQDH